MKRSSEIVGVIDWGIGGLGVVRAMRERGIRNPIVYVSDTGVTAYGRMTSIELVRRLDHLITDLHARGAGRVLIACNAASTVIDQVRTPVPATGVIQPALRHLRSERANSVGVIGGARTIRSGLYRRGLAQPKRVLLQRIAQPLSAHIELRTLHTAAGQLDLMRILRPLRDVRLLVLACTHYPAVVEQLETHVPRARMFDPARAVATELASQIPDVTGNADLELLTTGDSRAMRAAAIGAWGTDTGRCKHIDR